ncbi:TlpA disulfide reductase family protein [Labilibaculum manganireducens]|uniref:Thioredoxin domain-containing protein n=1 Tax=Labilibaculum manganireducens TaxID=1940525 RepID=A0A2N3HYZ7_9BACT|nr:TlpA disulfide reductase family protein [Labilibaculum manganireducens]PKQ63282.1 hypothetical protein BZG01_16305 [Labilibaculum manganireducens]
MNQFKIGLLTAIAAVMLGCVSEQSKPVRLRGHVPDLYYKLVSFQSQKGGGLYYSKDINVKVNEKGDFDTTLVLDQPGYYKAFRNMVYLSPGDDLEIQFDLDHKEQTQFKGTGSQASNYLIHQNLSFLGKNGKNVKSDFLQTKAVVDSLADIRGNELKEIKGLPASFVKDVQQIIVAKQIDAYMNHFYFTDCINVYDLQEFREKFGQGVKSIMPSINPLLTKLLSKDDLLHVPEVYSAVDDCVEYGDFKLTAYPKWDECISLNHFEKMLDETQDITPALVKETENRLASLSNEEYKNSLSKRMKRLKKFVSGAPVFDLQLEDANGKDVKLSDFKGKLIYIDFWATWCGPCRDELPFYGKIIEKFKGKDVVFLSISVDQDKEKWQSFIQKENIGSAQLLSKDMEAISKQWQVNGIPRFVLVGKDFTFVDAFADRPSSGEVIENKINSSL